LALIQTVLKPMIQAHCYPSRHFRLRTRSRNQIQSRENSYGFVNQICGKVPCRFARNFLGIFFSFSYVIYRGYFLVNETIIFNVTVTIFFRFQCSYFIKFLSRYYNHYSKRNCYGIYSSFLRVILRLSDQIMPYNINEL
jgi:hypothetical protein